MRTLAAVAVFVFCNAAAQAQDIAPSSMEARFAQASSRGGEAAVAMRKQGPRLAPGLLRFARDAAAECPEELGAATQLMLVSPREMSARAGSLVRFERASANAPWKRAGQLPVVLGWNGIRWAWSGSQALRGRGPVKTEGDGATPAGIFPVGAPFGFKAASLPGYVRLTAGRQFCVSEPQAPTYNTIVARRPAGLAGEDMGAAGLYRRGLFIEYPTNGLARGGSCLFIHVWRSPSARTDGCVATAEEGVAALQSWVRPKEALIAILPPKEAKQLEMCLGVERGG
jgi:hypothetical protein